VRSELDELDRRIVNGLQGGFPLSERPFTDAAERLQMDEETLIARLRGLLERGVLSRFGPLFNAERMGGAFSLVAMSVPPDALERVAGQVNAYREVAHNYEREHAFNLWFVLAVARPERIREVLAEIEAVTGYPVYDMPKEREFFVELRLRA
jgi:DNA-binding Lrp family transcriptional regulator